MGYTWQQKIRNWICEKIGHHPLWKNKWNYKGTHSCCFVCRKVITLNEDKWV